MLSITRTLITIMSIAAVSLHSGATPPVQFALWLHNTQQQVWDMDLPEFKSYEIPDSLKNESVVVLALHNSIETGATNPQDFKAGFMAGFAFGLIGAAIFISADAAGIIDYPDADISSTDLTRMLIAINDSCALNKFKTFDTGILNRTGITRCDIHSSNTISEVAVGIRVIKPSGETIELNLDSLLSTSGKTGDVPITKLDLVPINIPFLEIGDRLDAFSLARQAFLKKLPESTTILGHTEYPTLNNTGHIKIDKNLSAQYRAINGMPEPKDSTDKKGNHFLRWDIPYSQGTDESEISCRQTPLLNVNMYYPRAKDLTPPSVRTRRQGKIISVSSDEINSNAWHFIDAYCKQASKSLKELTSPIKGNPINEAKQKLETGEWTEEQAADFLYYNLMLAYNIWQEEPTKFQFLTEFGESLKKVGINHKYALVTTNDYGCLDNIPNWENLSPMIYLDKSDKFYIAPIDFTAPGELTRLYSGAEGEIESDSDPSQNHIKKIKQSLTLSNDKYRNARINKTTASILGSKVSIKRTTDLYGEFKSTIKALADKDELSDYLLSQLNNGTEKLKIKKSKSLERYEAENALSYKTKLSSRRNEEIAQTHKLPKQITANRFKIDSYGIDKADNTARYTTEYAIDSIIGMKGDTLIMDIGKLISCGIDPERTAGERKSQFSIAPTEYVDTLSVNFPDGYVAILQDVDNLNFEIETEFGKFSAHAEIYDGGIKITSIYRNNEKWDVEPKEWKKLTAIDKALAMWRNRTIRFVPTRPIMY